MLSGVIRIRSSVKQGQIAWSIIPDDMIIFDLQDVQYADIDYMENQRDFTIDETNFGDLAEYFKEIQARGMRIIIILVSYLFL